ncbi:MAG: hypothetical protein H6633_00065 [Anaerolineales bacterium]|nr:hypothetical protein [Anaerolineales bacterium]
MKLRPGGIWSDGESGPTSPADWVAVEKYMGLFERVKVLIDNGLVDIDTIDKLYGYRVINIVANKVIYHKKIKDEAEAWQKFIELWHALKKNHSER